MWANLHIRKDTYVCNFCACERRFKCKFLWAALWQNQQSECAPSEDSDQSGHPPSLISVFAVRSLISVFAVRMKKAWVLSYPLSAQRRLRSAWASQTGQMPRLIWVFAGRTVTLLVLSCRGSNSVYLDQAVQSGAYVHYDQHSTC